MGRIEDQIGQMQRCVYGACGDYCCERATLHVHLGDGEHTFACAAHAAWWDEHAHHDAHPVGGACGLPNTTWLYAQLTAEGLTPSRCVVEGLEDLLLVEHAEGVAC